MQSLNRRTFLSVLPLAPALAGGRNADEEDTSLFDGRTLAGWVVEDGAESAFYVDEGALAVDSGASSPTWLRSEREYENFDFRGEFFIKGWTDSGIFFHAARHGRPGWTGMQMKIFHQRDEAPTPQSMGAILPIVAPQVVNVRAGWNGFRILMDWPSLQIWVNGERIQDLHLESTPELGRRLRYGYLGIPTVAAACRFRNLRIRELPSKESWTPLYEGPGDFANWFVSEGEPNFQVLGTVLRCDGQGHIATRKKFRDFELHLYIRSVRAHNGGILFRSAGQGLKSKLNYEIQLHNVEEAHFPTGSLYYRKRAIYPRIEDEKWYLMQLAVQGKRCLVRINGETVLEYDQLEILDEGHIELQAHRRGYWTEFKRIRVKRL